MAKMPLVQKHKKPGDVKYTVLYQIRVYVDIKGVRIANLKFAVKPTSQQYLPVGVTDEMYAEHKFAPGLYERVKFKRLMQVESLVSYDAPDKISRSIYYLEGQQEEAIVKIRAELDQVIDTIKKAADLLHKAWTTRSRK